MDSRAAFESDDLIASRNLMGSGDPKRCFRRCNVSLNTSNLKRSGEVTSCGVAKGRDDPVGSGRLCRPRRPHALRRRHGSGEHGTNLSDER